MLRNSEFIRHHQDFLQYLRLLSYCSSLSPFIWRKPEKGQFIFKVNVEEFTLLLQYMQIIQIIS